MPGCLVVQHVAPEQGFAIDEALNAAGVRLDVCRVFAGQALPSDASHLDALVVMGGPMSAASDTGFETRRAEIDLLADAVGRGIPTMGVCLGAQLLAVAGGASVHRGEAGPEIGWGPVNLGPRCADDSLFSGLPSALEVLHWHGDTFELPDEAVPLASSGRYPNQAFRLGSAAWGIQFHLEITSAAVEGFLKAFTAEAEQSPGGSDALRTATPAALGRLVTWRDLVLRRFALLALGHSAGAR
jgi:GMP synthase-like glutamine amidotransferase